MQCRICFEEGGDLLSPCRCRGTSAYIHRTCLFEYIRHYPDRVCRSCRSMMTVPMTVGSMALLWSTYMVLATLLFLSQTRFIIKVGLLACLSALFFYYSRRGTFTRTPMFLVGALLLLFLPGSTDPTAIGLLLTAVVTVLGLLTLSLYVPVHYIMTMIANLLVIGYVAFFSWALYVHLDTFAFSTWLSIAALAWYAWMEYTIASRLHSE